MNKETIITDIIRKRRSIFPVSYTAAPVEEKIIVEMLENANFAPTHRITEPWRFRILRGGALERLSAFMVEDYQLNTPLAAQSELKIKKISENPLRAACIIGIVMKRQPDLLPEWEEVAAVSMAVQNMWLTATAYGLGAYWSSPEAIVARGNQFFDLADDEKCLGLFYVGQHNMPEIPAKRSPIMDKVVWENE